MIQKCNSKDNLDLVFLSDFLRIISEENRLKIICFLQKNDERCVCEIQEFLALPQNLISHHLKVLRDFSLLNHRKDGLKVYYSINHEELTKYKEILNKTLTKGEK
jgi:ArsR family transcriptional regulator, arsenate/arsenite/antimonite-responsive transcriptional repressor